jgi:hypothetical protein
MRDKNARTTTSQKQPRNSPSQQIPPGSNQTPSPERFHHAQKDPNQEEFLCYSPAKSVDTCTGITDRKYRVGRNPKAP